MDMKKVEELTDMNETQFMEFLCEYWGGRDAINIFGEENEKLLEYYRMAFKRGYEFGRR